MNELTLSQVNHLFEYKDGELLWKNPCHKNNLGKPVGYNNGNNYKKVTINKKQFYVHRIVYFMHHGYLPKIIDHIDNNKSNNSIHNLREATCAQNLLNRPTKKINQSGYRNVYFNKIRKKWNVRVKANGKLYCLGAYEDLELAGLVAEEARQKYQGDFFYKENK